MVLKIFETQMMHILIEHPNLTEECYKEYCEEIKQTPDLKQWYHLYNITLKVAKKLKLPNLRSE